MGFSPDIKYELAEQVETFVGKKSTLKLSWIDKTQMLITQKSDGRIMSIHISEMEEVLVRSDHEGDQFLQINLSFDRKILITKNLIGFKPMTITGLDMNRLPKVVTTVDLVSVLDAIEDLMTSDQQTAMVEIDVLKKVYHAIVSGGEKIGFKLDQEKRWLAYNFNLYQRATA